MGARATLMAQLYAAAPTARRQFPHVGEVPGRVGQILPAYRELSAPPWREAPLRSEMPQFSVTSMVSRERLLARALIVFVAVIVVGGLTVDAYVWHRNGSRSRTVATSPPL